MKSFREVIHPYTAFLAGLLVLVGTLAMIWAWLNLIGVPLQDSRSMDATNGWISVGVALISLTLAVFVRRWSP